MKRNAFLKTYIVAGARTTKEKSPLLKKQYNLHQFL
jgi:hypothetical protein